MKDNFSIGSSRYLKFRPIYPEEMIKEIISLVEIKDYAWDCGTGNGQLALILSKYFKEIEASDMSSNQIKNAIENEKINYKVEIAEKTNYQTNYFDLVTVAQAIHWFNFDLFYKEVTRVLKEKGIIAVIGYSLIRVNKQLDPIISDFYKNVVGSYWDKERRYIDEDYKTIPFPFKEIALNSYFIDLNWNFEQFIGYLGTWSAIKHYQDKNGINPVSLIYDELNSLWGDSVIKVKFPIISRIGTKVNLIS